jgi:hypothetical protein
MGALSVFLKEDFSIFFSLFKMNRNEAPRSRAAGN